MATTTTNFGWDIPQSTDLVKDGATAIAALGQDIDTAMVDLKGGTTGQVLAKASGADLDFSWVAQDDSNAIQNAIVDAKGDLIGATANDTPARLAVGTNGQVLTADSTAATGLAWATPVSSGGMTLLSTTALASLSTVTVSSISQSYKHLLVIIKDVFMVNVDNGAFMRFNSDTGSKYTTSAIRVEGTTPTYAAGINTSLPNVYSSNPTTNTAERLASSVINIYRYTETSTIPGDVNSISTQNTPTVVSIRYPFSYAASAPITSITLTSNGGNFSGGNLYIYGVN
jgi:hypothetical protein